MRRIHKKICDNTAYILTLFVTKFNTSYYNRIKCFHNKASRCFIELRWLIRATIVFKTSETESITRTHTNTRTQPYILFVYCFNLNFLPFFCFVFNYKQEMLFFFRIFSYLPDSLSLTVYLAYFYGVCLDSALGLFH